MKIRVLKLAALSAGPKLIALVRDLMVIKQYGLGIEAATMTTIVYATQFVANVSMPGVQALFLSGIYQKSYHKIWFKIIEILLIISYLIYLELYFSADIIQKKIEVMILLGISMYTSLEMNKYNVKYTLSTNKESSVLPYAADMLVNAGIVIYLIISTFEIKTFLFVLIAANMIATLIYRRNYSEHNAHGSDKKIYETYFGAITLTFIMSSTNIIDQTLLGYRGESDLSLFNFIQRYTFIIAGLSLMMVYRLLGSKVLNIDLRNIIEAVKKKGKWIIYAYSGLIILAYLSNDINLFNVPLVSIVISIFQIPVYIFYAFSLSIFISKINLLSKFFIGFVSLGCKYTYLVISGLSVNQIFVSHFILNLAGLIMVLFAVRFEMQKCDNNRKES